ncbi:threonine--tRNA ligase, mitochondrial-like [Dorcoceras hygrometricum]|uniref:Probable threonine--tRNA ligase, cytoplasmic n=1 Tax=Dorcoceras hygrometricum TaxID=472368 RepID=A0A2Z7CIS0_9LAMI|nr:threonine--tRNA ligase, mitochondrial-like [Dorcoceras hygrometricum]
MKEAKQVLQMLRGREDVAVDDEVHSVKDFALWASVEELLMQEFYKEDEGNGAVIALSMGLLKSKKFVVTIWSDEGDEKSKGLIKVLRWEDFAESFDVSKKTKLPKMVLWNCNEEYYLVIGSASIDETYMGKRKTSRTKELQKFDAHNGKLFLDNLHEVKNLKLKPFPRYSLYGCISSPPPMSDSAAVPKPSPNFTSATPPTFTNDGSYLQTVINKRIELFQTIQNQQNINRLTLSPDVIQITLGDGKLKEGKKWNTTPYDVAKEISKTLLSTSLVAKVDGVLWDMSRPLEGDCKLVFCNFDDDEGRDTFWHSSAHILGESLEQTYGCRLCIGPCTTRGEGFYYDAFYGDLGLNEDHFKQIEAAAKKAVDEKQPFERIEVTRDQAIDIFSDNQFKVEIIKDLPEDKTITVYRCGPLVDLCRGPHIPNTSFVKAFSCLKASSAYWRGNKDRESLQRVYGISFPDQKRLKEYKAMLEEAKKYDHRELGKKQELFFFHPLSPGSCFFLPHGARVCNKLLEFIRSQYRKRGYEEVWSPNIYNMQLWETSGHAANYKENMFVFEIEKQEFGLKPMNCPGHCLMFDRRLRSYRELPLRLADFGVLHRNEASGALTGLTRVRRFQQIKDEVKGVLEFISHVYGIFGFTFDLKLSTRPEKYLGDILTWEKAEAALAEALNESGKLWEINEGDGAFYGPKIDISVSDAMRRKFQCATLQLDFQLPARFNLSYSAEDETKRERPVMIHRAILGSVERMFAILLEHYKGKWPFWLSPRQAIVCPVSDKSQAYALQVGCLSFYLLYLHLRFSF